MLELTGCTLFGRYDLDLSRKWSPVLRLGTKKKPEYSLSLKRPKNVYAHYC